MGQTIFFRVAISTKEVAEDVVPLLWGFRGPRGMGHDDGQTVRRAQPFMWRVAVDRIDNQHAHY